MQAAEKAIANPLLDEISLKGAKGVLINITGGYDLTLFELDEAANRIREEVDPDANIIVGSTLDTEMGGMMRVSVVATGIDAVAKSDADAAAAPRHGAEPVPRRRGAARRRPRRSRTPAAARAAAAPPPAAGRATPSFADHRSRAAEVERQRALRRARGDGVPQPGADCSRTAPFGQPKIERRWPTRAAPGEPSPDALAPAAGRGAERAQGRSRWPPRPAAAARARAASSRLDDQQPDPPDDRPGRPRARPRRGRSRRARAARAAAAAREPAYEDTERERVDIPAFLRRQAN